MVLGDACGEACSRRKRASRLVARKAFPEDGGCRWSGSATTVVLPVKRVLDGAALEWGDDGGGRV